MVLKVILFSICLLISTCLVAQQDSPDIQHIIDDLFTDQDLPLNYEELYENILQYLQKPLNINSATAEELRGTYALSEIQIQNLIQYREQNGNLISELELQSIPLFDLQTIKRLIPFIEIKNTSFKASAIQPIIKPRNSYFILKHELSLEETKGFQQNTPSDLQFKGDPGRLYSRLRMTKPGRYSYGFTLEKDAGEPFDWSFNQPGFDFLSFHLQLKNRGLFQNLIIGDYYLQAGQGLVLGSGFSLGKGGETVSTVRKVSMNALPYTSTNENTGWRGFAATLKITNKLSFSPHFSQTHKDASLLADSLEITSVSSLPTSGLHRNEREIGQRKKIKEMNLGYVLNYQTDNLHIGAIWNTTLLEHPKTPVPTPYNTFTFRGKSNTNQSIFFNYNFRNFLLFGELANNTSGGMAYNLGIMGSLSTRFDITILFRNYEKNYHSLYANAFGENSLTQNETGLYQGFRYKASRTFQLNGYIDIFRFPWLRYRNYSPSEGHEWLLRINVTPTKSTQGYIQIREESKQRNVVNEQSQRFETIQNIKRNILMQLDMKGSEYIRLKTRIQFSAFENKQQLTSGFLFAQDIAWQLEKLKITARYSIFDTEDYDNRQYIYENDTWLSFSMPAYSGRGMRNYLLLDYNLRSWISLAFRYAFTRYLDVDSIGSGINEIKGNERHDVKIQAVLRF